MPCGVRSGTPRSLDLLPRLATKDSPQAYDYREIMLCAPTFSSVKDLVNRRPFDIFRAKDGAVPLIHTGAALPWKKLVGKVFDMDGRTGEPFGCEDP